MSSERKIGEWRGVSVNGGYRPELVRPTIRTNYGRINLRFVPCPWLLSGLTHKFGDVLFQ